MPFKTIFQLLQQWGKIEQWAALLAENKPAFATGMFTFIWIKITSVFGALLGIQLPEVLQFLLPLLEYVLSLGSTLLAAGLTVIISHHVKRWQSKKYPLDKP